MSSPATGRPPRRLRPTAAGAVSLLALPAAAPALAAAVAKALAPDPQGFWHEHLAWSSAAAAALVVLGGLVVLARRAGAGSVLNRLAQVGLVATMLGLAGRAAGEYRAAQALWGTEYGAAAAPVFGPSFPGWSDGVALSNAATVLLVIGGVVTVLALARTASAVLPVMALGLAAALTVVPPALLPGLNVGVALAAVTVGAAAARPQLWLRREASG